MKAPERDKIFREHYSVCVCVCEREREKTNLFQLEHNSVDVERHSKLVSQDWSWQEVRCLLSKGWLGSEMVA